MEIIQELLSKPIDLHVKYICEITKSEEAKYYVNQFERMEQKTLAGIYAELSSNIMVFATDKHIRAALPKKKNISPQDLEENHDIYLSIPEDKLDQWKLLFTLITNQFLKHFERQPDNSALPISFLLDELPRLGKVENVSSALTTLRSKKITICLIIQSLAQLDALYGSAQRRVILDNCAYKAVLNASDAKTQEYFSRLVGTQGITRQGESTNYEPENGEERSYTVSNHIVERRIIKPEDFATLKDVVLITNLGNFRAKKLEPIES
jgi:type IV secretion system protein VirD4